MAAVISSKKTNGFSRETDRVIRNTPKAATHRGAAALIHAKRRAASSSSHRRRRISASRSGDCARAMRGNATFSRVSAFRQRSASWLGGSKVACAPVGSSRPLTLFQLAAFCASN